MKRITHVLKQYDSMLTPFKPAVTRLVYIMIGLALGMLVVYLLVPVKFKNNAEPVQLDDGYRTQWVKGVAAEYFLTGDDNEVRDKLVAAGVTAGEVEDLAEKNQNTESGEWLNALVPVAQSSNSAASEQAESYPDPGFMSGIAPILIYLGLLIVGILAAVYLTLYPDPVTMIRWRMNRTNDPSVAIEKQKRARAKELSSQKSEFDTPPVVQFMSTYMSGDNFYDDSFAIETEDGRFLGECGSGIAETIGVGDVKKVTATEAWVFSQNDISTTTHILMTEHAYNDNAIRGRLAARGEAVLVSPGSITVLESKSLRTQIRVIDMAYVEDTPIPNSAFDRLTIEIAIWSKDDAGAGDGNSPIDNFMPPPIAQAPSQPAFQSQPAQQMPPQAPPQQQPYQPPPQQQPFQAPPQQMPPPQAPPTMAPPQQMPQRQPPPQAPQMRPPQQPMQPPPRQAPPQPPPQEPPSPYGDTNY